MPTILEIEELFNSIEIPQTVVFSKGITWHDVPQHVQQYISLIKQNGLGLYSTIVTFAGINPAGDHSPLAYGRCYHRTAINV